MTEHRPSSSRLVLATAVVATALVAGTGGAVAATAITSAQIRNGTIQTVDLAASTRKALSVVGGYKQVRAKAVFSGADPTSDSLTATCPSGTALISATADWDFLNSDDRVVLTYLTRSARADFFYLGPADNTVRVTAVCGRVSTR